MYCEHGKTDCDVCYAKGGQVKGVHKQTGDTSRAAGTSWAGREIERSKMSGNGKHDEDDRNFHKLRAKEDHHRVLDELKSMRNDKQYLAEGGFVDGMPDEGAMYDDDAADEDADMIARIMHKRRQYSEGGKVANDTGTGASADMQPNQFDDLVLDDDLDFSYDADNSGDKVGNKELDEDDSDLVSRIMKSRKKKDHNPRPA